MSAESFDKAFAKFFHGLMTLLGFGVMGFFLLVIFAQFAPYTTETHEGTLMEMTQGGYLDPTETWADTCTIVVTSTPPTPKFEQAGKCDGLKIGTRSHVVTYHKSFPVFGEWDDYRLNGEVSPGDS